MLETMNLLMCVVMVLCNVVKVGKQYVGTVL
jgi:hypothetical protein